MRNWKEIFFYFYVWVLHQFKELHMPLSGFQKENLLPLLQLEWKQRPCDKTSVAGYIKVTWIICFDPSYICI